MGFDLGNRLEHGEIDGECARCKFCGRLCGWRFEVDRLPRLLINPPEPVALLIRNGYYLPDVIVETKGGIGAYGLRLPPTLTSNSTRIAPTDMLCFASKYDLTISDSS